ncbi:MAG: hydrogenase maturation nickel metallochaperone HypA [Thiogranum sp.]
MSLCEGVLQILERQARIQSFTRVRNVQLEIGVFACVEPEAMQFGFAAVTPGTLAEGARLDIVSVAGEAWCLTCNRPVPVRSRIDVCPECGHELLPPRGGDELRIKELEVA